ncbi:unnamed protein product, partial [Heterosigma akashiwo]
MRIVIQKVKSASVTLSEGLHSSIGPGLLCLVGLHVNDHDGDLDYACRKITTCKLFDSDDGKLWRKNVCAAGKEILMVSQFTLYGDVCKQGKMDFKHAMSADRARGIYSRLLDMVKAKVGADRVQDGKFQTYMEVSLVNDGPITITLESHNHV